MSTLKNCAPCWGVTEIVQTDAYITEIMHARQFASYAHGYDKTVRLRPNILPAVLYVKKYQKYEYSALTISCD